MADRDGLAECSRKRNRSSKKTHESNLNFVAVISVVTVTATGTATVVFICHRTSRWRSVLVTVLLGNVAPLLLELLTVSRS